MKLSATTRSNVLPAEMSLALAASAPVPSVMRTRATIAVGNLAPTNESPAASVRTGATILARLVPSLSKNSIAVLSTTSTSLNTAPNPDTNAGVGWPATWKSTSITLLPTGEKILVGLKALNSFAYPALTSANLVLSLRKPVPGVVKTAPDLTVVLKNAAGKSFLLSNGLAPAPSHEISRRPAACSPAVPPLEGSPRSARNSSTLVAIAPVAETRVA